MNENLDLTEVLKDCPKGTKFYSSYLGTDVFFIEIDNNCIKCEYVSQIDFLNSIIQFKKDGSSYPGGECMLFPSKDQRDWLKWHRPFIDGDILTYTLWNKPTIYIYRENGTHNTSYYAAYSSANNKFYGDGKGALAKNRDDLRFATEEEKKKLFNAIKSEGYKWNTETKTLEKEKFDPKTLQPFDKVLVKLYADRPWCTDLFSYFEEADGYVICTGEVRYNYCIPYNDKTKHLVGKRNNAPEFYRYWEE
jgi:hypothetical protein